MVQARDRRHGRRTGGNLRAVLLGAVTLVACAVAANSISSLRAASAVTSLGGSAETAGGLEGGGEGAGRARMLVEAPPANFTMKRASESTVLVRWVWR